MRWDGNALHVEAHGWHLRVLFVGTTFRPCPIFRYHNMDGPETRRMLALRLWPHEWSTGMDGLRHANHWRLIALHWWSLA